MTLHGIAAPNLFGSGGGRGIRTLETLAGLTVFKTVAIDHSAIPPREIIHEWTLCGSQYFKNIRCKDYYTYLCVFLYPNRPLRTPRTRGVKNFLPITSPDIC